MRCSRSWAFRTDWLFTKVILPIGISFHTFQSMSYTIDAYRGIDQTERSFIRFLTFVSFFPQLVAGPIERAHNLLPQLQATPAITRQTLPTACRSFWSASSRKWPWLTTWPSMSTRSTAIPALFQAPALVPGHGRVRLANLLRLQRLHRHGPRDRALMMGFRMMLNFNNPYAATGLGDFWNRWHISLSTWFKDYLYFPLGGSRHGALQTYRNMFITMLISGIWHGAAWAFVIWGGLHALGRCLTRELEQTEFYQQRIPRLVKQLAGLRVRHLRLDLLPGAEPDRRLADHHPDLHDRLGRPSVPAA